MFRPNGRVVEFAVVRLQRRREVAHDPVRRGTRVTAWRFGRSLEVLALMAAMRQNIGIVLAQAEVLQKTIRREDGSSGID